MGGKVVETVPSKIVFKPTVGQTQLSFNVTGKNITLKDKDNNIINSVVDGQMSYVSVPSTTIDDVFTIEADNLLSCSFSYWSGLASISEFTVPNSNTGLYNCFQYCSNLTEVRNINIENTKSIVNLFNYCSNLTVIDPFYISAGIAASYCFYGTKISINPIINVEDLGIADYLFNSNTEFNDISSLQNKDLKWTSCIAFLANTSVSVIENLTFTKLTTLVFNNINSLTILRNISAPLCNYFSANYNPNLTTVDNINIPVCTGLDGTFSNCPLLTSVTNLLTSNLLSISSAFNSCTSLDNIPTLNIGDNTTGFNSTFSNCTSLTDISSFVNFVNNYNGSTPISCVSTFSGCTGITTFPAINLNKASNCSNMFAVYGVIIYTLNSLFYIIYSRGKFVYLLNSFNIVYKYNSLNSII
jgi:hypothetical protein